jgi:hypothetical protein
MNVYDLKSWEVVSLRELFFAYRKAKADCFYERSIYVARQFALYERNLADNLLALLQRLQHGEINSILAENLGRPRAVAKKLGLEPKKRRGKPAVSHGFFSDPTRAFEWLRQSHDLMPEFRLIGDFSPTMHVLSALWINQVGHKFDAALSSNAYGMRLRRYRPEAGSPPGTIGKYHLEAVGSFEPYFNRYKAWRRGGMDTIRSELTADRNVIAVSMDLTSYYHFIDPSFISNIAFLTDAGINLSPWELSFTTSFANALSAWSMNAQNLLLKLGCDAAGGGLPIGIAIAPIIANALLIGIDRDIKQGLAPVYYGRYVDDMFLVLRDPGNVKDSADLLRFIAARTSSFPSEVTGGTQIQLSLPETFKGQSSLRLQQSKQKLFFLQGQGGLDLLANIETQIRSVSSERRLMQSPEKLEKMASAKVLTAASQATEEADTLRRADGLAVRRMGWSIQLRAVETLARDLRPPDWREERSKFYDFAHNHILRPDRILDHMDYLPRLLSLAVALMDWADANRLIDAAFASIKSLETEVASDRIKINGIRTSAASDLIWSLFADSVRESAADAVVRAIRWTQRNGGVRAMPKTATALFEKVGLGSDVDIIAQLSRDLRETDWAKIAYKDHLRRDATRQAPMVKGEEFLYGIYEHEMDLREFLSQSMKIATQSSVVRVNPRCISGMQADEIPSLLPYLFPTRPYTTQEVSLFLPSLCVFGSSEESAARDWARFVRALRGVWVWSKVADAPQPGEMLYGGDDSPPQRMAAIGCPQEDLEVRLGISSLMTTEHSFRAGASGRADISRLRYKRIQSLVNQAIQANPRPTHLLLPELALPDRWIDTVSGLLRDAGISLIAGLDYHVPNSKEIASEAVLVLRDDRLGFPSTVQIRQAKTQPAPAEEETLLRLFGRVWIPLSKTPKPVYSHYGFRFGILVCSELQNVSHRLDFQGKVDCVIVLAWNQDLETFSALVEAGSLDVHAHIALVNNRKYGDSRVRSPRKQTHERDVCRIRGGENEHLVVVKLDWSGLREFQNRDRRWPRDGDPYKPVPEGFVVAKNRRAIPG